ncbi:MAG: ParA family protein, partial [Patescibacteria group bacterium]
MTKIISVFNLKGGVGKSTSTYNIAFGMALRGYKVALIDLDVQLNLSDLVEVDEETAQKVDLVQIINNSDRRGYSNQLFDSHFTQTSNNENLFFLYNINQIQSTSFGGSEIQSMKLLRRSLETLLEQEIFDYIIIDCPPSIERPTSNSLVASDYLLIPTQSGDGFSIASLHTVYETVKDIKDINPKLEILGVFVNKAQRNTIAYEMTKDALSDYSEYLGERATIDLNTKIAEASINHQSVYETRDAKSKAQYDE